MPQRVVARRFRGLMGPDVEDAAAGNEVRVRKREALLLVKGVLSPLLIHFHAVSFHRSPAIRVVSEPDSEHRQGACVEKGDGYRILVKDGIHKRDVGIPLPTRPPIPAAFPDVCYCARVFSSAS